MKLDELKEACYRLISYISDVELLKHIKNILEYLVRRVE